MGSLGYRNLPGCFDDGERLHPVPPEGRPEGGHGLRQGHCRAENRVLVWNEDGDEDGFDVHECRGATRPPLPALRARTVTASPIRTFAAGRCSMPRLLEVDSRIDGGEGCGSIPGVCIFEGRASITQDSGGVLPGRRGT